MDGSFDLGAKWDTLAKGLEVSYFAHKRIHHITSRYLPNRLEVHDLLKKLFELPWGRRVFPLMSTVRSCVTTSGIPRWKIT